MESDNKEDDKSLSIFMTELEEELKQDPKDLITPTTGGDFMTMVTSTAIFVDKTLFIFYVLMRAVL